KHPKVSSCLFRLCRNANLLGNSLEAWINLDGAEIASRPFLAFLLLFLTELTLLVFDLGLFGRGKFVVTLSKSLSNLGPGTARLERRLILDRGESERCDGVGGRSVIFEL